MGASLQLGKLRQDGNIPSNRLPDEDVTAINLPRDNMRAIIALQ